MVTGGVTRVGEMVSFGFVEQFYHDFRVFFGVETNVRDIGAGFCIGLDIAKIKGDSMQFAILFKLCQEVFNLIDIFFIDGDIRTKIFRRSLEALITSSQPKFFCPLSGALWKKTRRLIMYTGY